MSGLVGFGDANLFPLRWGEVIPLHFILGALKANTPVTVVSQPNRRYTESVQMIPELLKLGKHLVEFTVYIHVPHLHTCTHTHKNC